MAGVMRVRRRLRSSRFSTAACLAAGLMVAACGEGAGRQSPVPQRDPVSVSPTAEGASGTEAAVATYRSMWVDMEQAGRTADVDSPRLSDHATGAALQLLKYGLSKDRQDGVVAKGTVSVSPRVVSAEPPRDPSLVQIQDCFDDTRWLIYKADGTLKNDVPGGHYDTKATVQHTRDGWKVVKLYLGAVGSC